MEKIWYTDGSCKKNPGPGGWGALQLDSDYNLDDILYNKEQKTNLIISAFYQGQEEKTTNNRMELTAILKVAKLAAEDPNNEYIIYSDSNYCINSINNWMWKWASNDWMKVNSQESIENKDLIIQLYNLFNTPFFNAQVLKIAGHSGIIGNELADRLACNKMNEFYDLCSKNKIFFDFNIKLL